MEEKILQNLPQNIEAEQSLLSSILMNNRVYERISEFLRAEDFAEKSLIEGINSDDVKILENADYLAINKLAIDWSDALIMGSESINEDLLAYAKASGKTFMDYKNGDEYVQAYSDLYDSLIAE